MEPFERLVGSVGRWPSLDSTWNETDFELDDILLSLTRTRPFAHLPLFTADIQPDFEDPSSFAIYVSDWGDAVSVVDGSGCECFCR